jgi:hypothetical protein
MPQQSINGWITGSGLMGRALPVLLALVIIGPALAGCIGLDAMFPHEEGPSDPAEDPQSPQQAPWGPRPADKEDNHTQPSASNGTAEDPAAEDEDEGQLFRLPLSPMRWSKKDLSVLVVPPGYGRTGDTDPFQATFLRAVEDSITHWQEAIDDHGPGDIRGNITFTVHVLGRDILSPTELPAVDIYITNPPGGIGLAGLAAYPLSPRCVIANLVTPVHTYEYMFMVNAHEFGHCLGLSHPEDHQPWYDLMSYNHIHQGSDPDLRLDCVSNMNLEAVHRAFANAFGRPQNNSAIEMYESEYELLECADRFLGP